MRCLARLLLVRRLGLFAGCTWLLGGVALAQQPVTGLSPTREPVFSVHLFQSFDHQTRPTATTLAGVGDGDFARTGVRAEAKRTFGRTRSSFDIGGAAQFSHDAANDRWLADEEWVAARLQLHLSRLSSLTLSQRVGYSEVFTAQAANAAQAVGSGALIDVADQVTRGLASFSVSSAASLSRILTRRSSVLLAYDFNRTAYTGGGVAVGNHRLSVTTDRAMARDWSVRAGYASAWGETASARDNTSAYRHEFHVRTMYRIPFLRGTVVSAGLAPALLGSHTDVRNSPGAAAAPDYGAFAMQGQAGIDHTFGSAARIGFAYERTASFPPGSTRPILANAMTARGAGQLSRRVGAQFSASSSRGTLSARSVSAWARVDARVSAAALLYVEYSRDTRENSSGVSWVPGSDRNYASSSLRVGVNIDFGWSGLARGKM